MMIELKSVSKQEAIHNISIKIKKNELIILHGVSGSGKSTLLHIIASFSKPSSGSVFISGEDISKYTDYHAANYRKKTIGYITQNFYLFETLTVYQNLLPSTTLTHTSLKTQEQAILKALKMAKIDHKANTTVHHLSGGEKQRLIIARALVNNPEIILCDEPTANLDAKNSNAFLSIIQELKAFGKTIIIATHDPLFENLKDVDKKFILQDGYLE